MKSKTWLILLTLTVVLLLAYSGKVISGYFSDGESSTDNVLRVKSAPLFGPADSFAVLAGSGITNTGATTITGDIGSFPTYTVPGGSITLSGTNHTDDTVTQGAKDDLVIAYIDAAGRPATHDVVTELGETSPEPGVYYNSVAGTFGITGTLIHHGRQQPGYPERRSQGFQCLLGGRQFSDSWSGL